LNLVRKRWAVLVAAILGAYHMTFIGVVWSQPQLQELLQSRSKMLLTGVLVMRLLSPQLVTGDYTIHKVIVMF